MTSDATYVPLEKLDLSSINVSIVVRVIRLWEARNFKRDHALMSLDFLLLDDKDGIIQGSIPVKYIDKFKEYIREGDVFDISNFDVIRSSDRFKIMDHNFMIRFRDETTIKQSQGNHSIQLEKFRLRRFEELLNLADKGQDLPDVIGFICCNIPNPEDIHGPSKRVPLRLLLEDGVKVRVTLWDHMADVFYDKLSNTNDKTIVIIVTSVNPKIYGRDLILNTTSSSKLYLNSDFEIEKQFRKRIKSDPGEVAIIRGESVNSQSTITKKISEILEFLSQDKKQETEFWCKAKVKEVDLQNGWNYIACSICAKKIDKIGTTLSCNSCKKTQVVGILRYRIELIVDDSTATTKFIIFDREAKRLTKKEASEIINEEVSDPTAEKKEHQDVPECIRTIVGRTLNFQIKVAAYNFEARYQSFTVSRVLDDNIIKKEKDASEMEDNTEGRKRERETELTQKNDLTEEEKSRERNNQGLQKQAAPNKKIKKEDDSSDNKYPGLFQ